MSTQTGNDFNLEALFQTLLPRMKKSEAEIKALLNQMGSDITTSELIRVQAKTQEWTLTAQLNSNLIKELGDTLKGIVQKAA